MHNLSNACQIIRRDRWCLNSSFGGKMNKRPHVLIADDEASICNVLQQYLSQRDWDVTTVSNGQLAIEAMEKHTFDVAILDINMPELNGLQVLKIAVARFFETDVIILTGYGNSQIAVEAMKNGAKDYFEKPIDYSGLIATVSALIEAKNTRPHITAQRMDQFVKDRLGDTDLKLSRVLEKFKMSESYACKLFKETFGMTFRQRLAKHRIDYAKHLLETTQEQIGIISARSGFGSQQRFRDVFFRLEKMSPRQYRKNCIGKQ